MRVDDDQVIRWFTEFSNWGRWGADDTLGALNLITAEKRRSAAALVEHGTAISLARTVEWAPRPDPGEALIPPLHFMQAAGDSLTDDGSGVAVDWVGLPLHGLYLTHLDAHSHVFWGGRMYNDQPATAVSVQRGAQRGGIDTVRDGIFTRGVLLDVAAVRGSELGMRDTVTTEDLVAAENRAAVRVEPGDVVLVRTGYDAARHNRSADESSHDQPGLATSCLPWIHDRSPAVLATDTATDPTWAHAGRIQAPVHAVCMVAMGMWVIDGCDLERLAGRCRQLARFEFLFTAAPLRLKNSTGSPLNPVAIL